ncbi:hypothetical protein ACFL01_04910, partial [Planctomycetota bacterium]
QVGFTPQESGDEALLEAGDLNDLQAMLEAAGRLYVRGVEVDFERIERPWRTHRRRLSMPGYPFRKERCWIAPVEGEGTESDRITRARNLLYSLVWRQMPREGETLPAPFVPDAAKIVERLLETRRSLLSANADMVSTYAQGVRAQETASLNYILRSCVELGWPWKPGELISASVIWSTWGLPDTYIRRTAYRLMEILEEEGYLGKDGDSFRILRDLEAPDADGFCSDLIAAHPEAHVELTLLQRCSYRRRRS